MALTVDALTLVGCDRAKAQEHLPHITAAMLAHDISTPPRARFFLAQALHECGLLRWMEEIWGPNQWQRTYDGRLGNSRAGDGYRYRGRGPFMLTGRGNYRTFGGKLGRPYENDPDVVSRPADGWLVAARYWSDRGLSALADRGDSRGVTRGINGAATDGAPSHHLHRMAIYARLPADCTPVRPDPYRCLTAQERDAIEGLDMERRCAKRNGGWERIDPSHLRHAQMLKAELVDLRKAIWRAAESESSGWDVKRRKERFEVLKKATAA